MISLTLPIGHGVNLCNIKWQMVYFHFDFLLFTCALMFPLKIGIANDGLVAATSVSVSAPDDPILSVISFGKPSSDQDADTFMLDVGESATLQVMISPRPDEALTSVSGSIVVQSLEVASRLSYRQARFFTSIENICGDFLTFPKILP